jgi:acid phosphatase type 7
MGYFVHLRRSILAALAAYLLVGLSTPAARATTIPKGPYLLNATLDGVTVVWQTDSLSDSRVSYTPAGGAAASVYSSASVTLHQMRLTGLPLDTAYTFSVTSEGGAGSVTSAAGSFRTAPSGTTAFRFAVYGDNRSQPAVHGQVADAVAAAAPRFVMNVGDLSSDSRNDTAFEDEFFVPAKAMLLQVPFYAALGNHEADSALYYQYFAGMPTGGGTGGMEWYSFDYGSAHFTVLDTNIAYAPGSAQYQWLVGDLEGTAASWRFVLTHHPAYSSGAHGSDPNVDAYLVPLFESYHVDAVFQGHDHLYEHSLKSGTHYFVSGGGGAPLNAVNSTYNPYQLYALSAYHYVTVDVSGSTATIQAHATNGTIFDTVTLSHDVTAPPVASFTATPLSGVAPLDVAFTDLSLHSPTAWAWEFGDTGASAAQHPSHTYAAAGTYTVSLTATNADGSDIETKTGYIIVSPHTLSVTADPPAPASVASGGTTSLSGTAADSGGHLVSWAWSDGGAGGSFSPSSTVQSPSYTAPANTSDGDLSVTLTVSVSCSGGGADSDSTLLTVTPVPHLLSVGASATPEAVASGGGTSLTAAATDLRGHVITSWSWSDGGAGGSFSNTAAQHPTYTAPANLTDGDVTVTLTVTATCGGPTPMSSGGSTALTVHTVAHEISVSASATPGVVVSRGATSLTATATDARGHAIASWSWSDGGAGGSFSDAAAQNPTYTAPVNLTGADVTIALTVTAICDDASQVSGTALASLLVAPAPVVPAPAADFSAAPTRGKGSLSVDFTDLSGDAPTSWLWSFGDGGTAVDQNPDHAYLTPGWYTVALTATNEVGPDTETKGNYVTVSFLDVEITPLDAVDHWALYQVLACVKARIVQGYDDGTYRPLLPVSRDQMAVYISRALAGGDGFVPTGPAVATFTDVPTDFWAYKYVEYAVNQNVVQGYDDNTYRPTVEVDRGQMAVYTTRGMVAPSGDAGVPTGPAVAIFPDVPTDFWAFSHVEYAVNEGVVQGYDDGTYRPATIVTRDQMAVYVQRAFDLPQ